MIAATPAISDNPAMEGVALTSLWVSAVRAVLDFVVQLGAPWIFGTDEPEGLLEPLGWEVPATDFAVIGHQFGRWPFPLIPRVTPGVRRVFW